MFFFLIPAGIFVVAMLAFAFWPRTRHVVDLEDLEHPGHPDHPGPPERHDGPDVS